MFRDVNDTRIIYPFTSCRTSANSRLSWTLIWILSVGSSFRFISTSPTRCNSLYTVLSVRKAWSYAPHGAFEGQHCNQSTSPVAAWVQQSYPLGYFSNPVTHRELGPFLSGPPPLCRGSISSGDVQWHAPLAASRELSAETQKSGLPVYQRKTPSETTEHSPESEDSEP